MSRLDDTRLCVCGHPRATHYGAAFCLADVSKTKQAKLGSVCPCTAFRPVDEPAR